MSSRKHFLRFCIFVFGASLSRAFSFSGRTISGSTGRREAFDILARVTLGAAVAGVAPPAVALDMDSFEKSLIEKDTTECDPQRDAKCIPKLTADEALCKYGVSGADARTAACRRVRDVGGQLPSKKTGERSTQGWLNGDIALTAK